MRVPIRKHSLSRVPNTTPGGVFDQNASAFFVTQTRGPACKRARRLFRDFFVRDFFLHAMETRRLLDGVEPNVKTQSLLRRFDPHNNASHSAPHLVPATCRVGPAYQHPPRVRARRSFERVARLLAAPRLRDAKRHPRVESRAFAKRRDLARGFRERASHFSCLTRERSPPLEGVLKRLPENPRRGAF